MTARTALQALFTALRVTMLLCTSYARVRPEDPWSPLLVARNP
ncbi:MAG TPA: hypothetical protein VKT22_02810 [Steroidobacteraceae bacterium]|nr:hypothetical protein [Steroidobacteraceae bacterium]